MGNLFPVDRPIRERKSEMNHKDEYRTPLDRAGEDVYRASRGQYGGCGCRGREMMDEGAARMQNNTAARSSSCRCGEESYTPGAMSSNGSGRRTGERAMGRSSRECQNETGTGNCTDSYPLAMVYSPLQSFRSLYEVQTGFCHGTVFKELDFPFYATPCRRRETRL